MSPFGWIPVCTPCISLHTGHGNPLTYEVRQAHVPGRTRTDTCTYAHTHAYAYKHEPGMMSCAAFLHWFVSIAMRASTSTSTFFLRACVRACVGRTRGGTSRGNTTLGQGLYLLSDSQTTSMRGRKYGGTS